MSVDDRYQDVWRRKQAERNNGSKSEQSPLHTTGGGGTSDGVTEDWKDSVDRQLNQLHSDVRNLLYGLIGGFLLLAGGGYALYNNLSEKIVDQRVAIEKLSGDIATRDAVINGKIDVILEKLPSKK